MADKPIIFSAPMVRALLAGAKTQTRRILPEQPSSGQYCARVLRHPDGQPSFHAFEWRSKFGAYLSEATVRFAVGDRLYVREAHYLTDDGDEQFAVYACEDDDVREHLARIDSLPAYISDEIKAAYRKLRPSIHMPRWASRLTLTVTDVRVQRLQDISEADARAEGITETVDGWWTGAEGQAGATARAAYAILWNSLHGPDAWAANPFVVALTFRITPANVDSLAEAA